MSSCGLWRVTLIRSGTLGTQRIAIPKHRRWLSVPALVRQADAEELHAASIGRAHTVARPPKGQKSAAFPDLTD